jgi:phytoene dehydrogenase-like protein
VSPGVTARTDYDYIVVGSGITGLTVSRILSQHGAGVLLLEKAATLGGSASRFQLQGVPFDIGFHFTGGFMPDGSGVLDDMLSLLGVRDRIRPIYYPRETCHHMVFPSMGTTYDIPCGVVSLREKLKRDFPSQRDGLDRFFERFLDVIARTPTLTVAGLDQSPERLEEDGVTLRQVLDELIPDPLVQAILGGFCMCYGTPPREVPFATHCRICFGLHETLAKVEGGGQAFVDALVEVLWQTPVEIRTGVTIQSCQDIVDRKAERFVLTDGSEVSAKACVFTIHPRNILELLPREHISRAFWNRVQDFEPSVAFFAVFGQLEGNPTAELQPIVSILPDLDIDAMMTCRTPEPIASPMAVFRSREEVDERQVETFTALEVTFPQWTQRWANSTIHKRPRDYYQYKQACTESILQRMEMNLNDCRGRLRLMDSSSNLTFRDYLHTPDGAAYGIKQKLGQFNVLGRLPIHNLYAAGQCALLPGIVGAITSSFLVCRNLLGQETFRQFLAGVPCR